MVYDKTYFKKWFVIVNPTVIKISFSDESRRFKWLDRVLFHMKILPEEYPNSFKKLAYMWGSVRFSCGSSFSFISAVFGPCHLMPYEMGGISVSLMCSWPHYFNWCLYFVFNTKPLLALDLGGILKICMLLK